MPMLKLSDGASCKLSRSRKNALLCRRHSIFTRGAIFEMFFIGCALCAVEPCTVCTGASYVTNCIFCWVKFALKGCTAMVLHSAYCTDPIGSEGGISVLQHTILIDKGILALHWENDVQDSHSQKYRTPMCSTRCWAPPVLSCDNNGENGEHNALINPRANIKGNRYRTFSA